MSSHCFTAELERVGEPHVKHLEGRLWEIRLKGRSGISRSIPVRGDARGSGAAAGGCLPPASVYNH